jgi:8-oxo-dGTP pyrophosphatase MutT (NUDIX family)
MPASNTSVSVTYLPRDNEARRFPVSVKGVVIRGGNVILLRNEREEWELPGGKLELCEAPEQCLAREIAEELHLAIQPESILASWVYTIVPGVDVLVIAYGCVESSQDEAVLSDEHKELRWFPLAEIDALKMPEGYKASIRSWAEQMRASADSVD